MVISFAGRGPSGARNRRAAGCLNFRYEKSASMGAIVLAYFARISGFDGPHVAATVVGNASLALQYWALLSSRSADKKQKKPIRHDRI